MKQVTSKVLSNEEITPGTYILRLQAPEIAAAAQPGQFVMIRCGEDQDLVLRRPISIHRTVNGEQIDLLFQKIGKGTEWLSCHHKDDSIDLIGPLGNGFSIYPESRSILLVAGGIGIAPLVFLAEKALNNNISITMLMGASNASSLYPEFMLPLGIKLVTATDDGSEGRKAMVTELIADYIDHSDQVFACGPQAMYKSLASQYKSSKPMQISLEERMGCGVGACYSCTIKTKKGLKQVCKDGPVFDLDDIL